MHQPDNPCIHHKGFTQAFDNIHSIHVQTRRGSLHGHAADWLVATIKEENFQTQGCTRNRDLIIQTNITTLSGQDIFFQVYHCCMRPSSDHCFHHCFHRQVIPFTCLK